VPAARSASRWLLVAVAIALAAGITFRFASLDRKIYWQDEAWTLMRVSGYWSGDVKRRAFNGQDLAPGELRQYQQPGPERSVAFTVLALAADDPKHPPLYFVAARLWMALVGDSVGALRSLSAVLSLLVLPGVFWLCRELFDSPAVGWTATVLVAVSPLHVLYAQEARPYSLLTLATVVSSAALLRAIRLGSTGTWRTYAVTVALGLYAQGWFLSVCVAHAAYTWLVSGGRAGERLPSALAAYRRATLLAFAAFAPWAAIIAIRFAAAADSSGPIFGAGHRLYRLKGWLLSFSSLFVDPSGSVFYEARHGLDTPWAYVVRLPLVLLAGYAFWRLRGSASARAWTFVACLGGATAFILSVPGIALGWPGLARARYWIPFYVAVQVAVAHLLATGAAGPHPVGRRAHRVLGLAIVVAGVVSCAISMRAEVWWTKGDSGEMQRVAEVVNRLDGPLLIALPDDGNLARVLALSALLDGDTRLRLVDDLRQLRSPDGFHQVFVLKPPARLRRALEEQSAHRLVPVFPDDSLWRATRSQLR
jgi:uncharacterized membrane protein